MQELLQLPIRMRALQLAGSDPALAIPGSLRNLEACWPSRESGLQLLEHASETLEASQALLEARAIYPGNGPEHLLWNATRMALMNAIWLEDQSLGAPAGTALTTVIQAINQPGNDHLRSMRETSEHLQAALVELATSNLEIDYAQFLARGLGRTWANERMRHSAGTLKLNAPLQESSWAAGLVQNTLKVRQKKYNPDRVILCAELLYELHQQINLSRIPKWRHNIVQELGRKLAPTTTQRLDAELSTRGL